MLYLNFFSMNSIFAMTAMTAVTEPTKSGTSRVTALLRHCDWCDANRARHTGCRELCCTRINPCNVLKVLSRLRQVRKYVAEKPLRIERLARLGEGASRHKTPQLLRCDNE